MFTPVHFGSLLFTPVHFIKSVFRSHEIALVFSNRPCEEAVPTIAMQSKSKFQSRSQALDIELIHLIEALAAQLLSCSPADIARDVPFRELGLDSAGVTMLGAELARTLDRPIPVPVMWTHATVRALAGYLAAPTDRTAAGPLTHAPANADEPIALVGLGCRVPASIASPGELWAALLAEVDAVREVPADRWDLARWFSADPEAPGTMTARCGAFLDDVAAFDAGFFRISPREARQIDPQQRLALEVAVEALEDARIVPSRLAGGRTGVFFGAMWHDYALLAGADPRTIEPHSATGWDTSVISARIAYALGLRGPALTVATACSSSLVALHLATQSLRRGETDLALVGGVNLMLHPLSSVLMSKFGALGPAGRCRAFAAGADGYVRGEGCVVVAARRLSDAVHAGDRIYALIRGTAINNDGASNGIAAPNPVAQIDVLEAAWRDAGIAPAEVGYVEAHGTGTPLGDPIEASALAAVFAQDRQAPLAIGSVKTNFGHLEAAAGLLGLAKAALSLFHGELPRSLHFDAPNPHIDFDAQRLEVVQARRPWPEGRRLAGVSSFGFGGTNAHVALEQAPFTPRSRPRPRAVAAARGDRGLVWFFSGHGGQWPGMARELIATDAVFRAAIERCDHALHPVTGWSVVRELAGEPSQSRIEQTRFSEPAIFALQIALAEVLAHAGVRPDAVIGQSIGEIAAAVVSGALTLDDGARVVARWADLVTDHACGTGGILVIDCAAEAAAALIEGRDGLSVAGVLSPRHTCLAGSTLALAELASVARGLDHRIGHVRIDYPCHGPAMAATAERLAAELGELPAHPAALPLWSTVTAGPLVGPEMSAAYWARNMREPMRIAEAMARLVATRPMTVVELGPHPIIREGLQALFESMARPDCRALASCRRGEPGTAGLATLMHELARDGLIDAPTAEPPSLIVVSGKSPAALRNNCARLAGAIESEGEALGTIAGTLAVARDHHPHRVAVVAADRAHAA
ncbi:MAG TPA: beta-ketoacyl synthase N-terminal-like domain-containing protein, partial [Kofleriaceae bacterium]